MSSNRLPLRLIAFKHVRFFRAETRHDASQIPIMLHEDYVGKFLFGIVSCNLGPLHIGASF